MEIFVLISIIKMNIIIIKNILEKYLNVRGALLVNVLLEKHVMEYIKNMILIMMKRKKKVKRRVLMRRN